jgi:nicotinamidase/pyrazinamidase
MSLESFHPIALGIDMQNTFCPGGELAVVDGDKVMSPFNDVSAEVRKQKGRVVLTRDYHPANTNAHFEKWGAHGVAGTFGAEFHKNLFIDKNDIIISKGMDPNEDAYSAFHGFTADGQTLADIIKHEVYIYERVVLGIGGLATEYCDEASIIGALDQQRIYGAQQLAVVALTDCMRAVNINPTDGADSIARIEAAGAILMTSSEFIDRLTDDGRF